MFAVAPQLSSIPLTLEDYPIELPWERITSCTLRMTPDDALPILGKMTSLIDCNFDSAMYSWFPQPCPTISSSLAILRLIGKFSDEHFLRHIQFPNLHTLYLDLDISRGGIFPLRGFIGAMHLSSCQLDSLIVRSADWEFHLFAGFLAEFPTLSELLIDIDKCCYDVNRRSEGNKLLESLIVPDAITGGRIYLLPRLRALKIITSPSVYPATSLPI